MQALWDYLINNAQLKIYQNGRGTRTYYIPEDILAEIRINNKAIKESVLFYGDGQMYLIWSADEEPIPISECDYIQFNFDNGNYEAYCEIYESGIPTLWFFCY